MKAEEAGQPGEDKLMEIPLSDLALVKNYVDDTLSEEVG